MSGDLHDLDEIPEQPWPEAGDGSRVPEFPFSCCEHCGCGTPEGQWTKRLGHDDTCRHGCNDSELEAFRG